MVFSNLCVTWDMDATFPFLFLPLQLQREIYVVKKVVESVPRGPPPMPMPMRGGRGGRGGHGPHRYRQDQERMDRMSPTPSPPPNRNSGRGM